MFFYRAQQSKPEFLTFFSALWLSNWELWVSNYIFLWFQNPGFQFPVSNPTQYFTFQVSKFLTKKAYFLVYFNRPIDKEHFPTFIWRENGANFSRQITKCNFSQCDWQEQINGLPARQKSYVRSVFLVRLHFIVWKYSLVAHLCIPEHFSSYYLKITMVRTIGNRKLTDCLHHKTNSFFLCNYIGCIFIFIWTH